MLQSADIPQIPFSEAQTQLMLYWKQRAHAAAVDDEGDVFAEFMCMMRDTMRTVIEYGFYDAWADATTAGCSRRRELVDEWAEGTSMPTRKRRRAALDAMHQWFLNPIPTDRLYSS